MWSRVRCQVLGALQDELKGDERLLASCGDSILRARVLLSRRICANLSLAFALTSESLLHLDWDRNYLAQPVSLTLTIKGCLWSLPACLRLCRCLSLSLCVDSVGVYLCLSVLHCRADPHSLPPLPLS